MKRGAVNHAGKTDSKKNLHESTFFFSSCKKQTYKIERPSARMVCLPDAPDPNERANGGVECETAFDCGFSDLESAWSKCRGGRCLRVVE